MTVYLNGQLVNQPAILEEDPIPIQTDVTAIDGSQQRNYITTKWQAQMSFSDLTISSYRQIMSIVNTGSGVVYYNDYSAETGGTLTFSGLATFKKYPYEAGSSLWQQLDVLIRQQ